MRKLKMILAGALVMALTASTGVAYAMMGGMSRQTVSGAMYGPGQYRGVMDEQHYQEMLKWRNSVAGSVYGMGPKAGMGMGKKMMGNKTFGPRWNR